MLIGVVADTHGLLRPELLSAVSGVDRIVHAGDIGDPDILVALGTIAPVTAVWGNTDGWELRARLPETASFRVEGVAITVLHGHQLAKATARSAAATYPGPGVVVFGHSHRPEVAELGETLALNPGSAGPARFTLPVTAALLTIADGQAAARIVQLINR